MEQQLLTVLIVDDELPLRQQLKNYDWEAMGATIIGEAEDGEEALVFCREQMPDVVFTDITMPIMDGMEFLERLRAEQIPAQVILLTCHSEFHFAKGGLQHGAIEYLIKTALTENELRNALTRARSMMEKESIVQERTVATRHWAQTLHIHRLLESELAPAEIDEAFGAAGLHIRPSSCMAGIHLECYSKDRQFLAREIQAVLNRDDAAYAWYPLHEGYLLLYDDRNLTLCEIVNRLHSNIDNLYKELGRTFSFIGREYRLIGWVSPPCATSEEHYMALQGIVKNAYRFFYMPDTVHVLQASFALENTAEKDSAAMDELEFKLQALGNSRKELHKYFTGDFARWCSEYQPTVEELKRFLAQWLQRLTKPTQQDAWLWRQNPIIHAFTLEQLVQSIIHLLSEEANSESKLRPEVRKTIEQIQRRISEPITLNSISEEVGLRAHYLGKLFREGVGESFNEYLSKLRIQKAIQLLSTSNLKVYEVADQVGVKSYRYFTILFRQYTGLTPSEFKKE
ncbi:response regulator [Paenibacillus oryzisoli]|uniref:response regulator transcription factor n=1 Tax=Paenibacillus oryzisoli TaxID=1850517 RepID=UPI003D26E6B4